MEEGKRIELSPLPVALGSNQICRLDATFQLTHFLQGWVKPRLSATLIVDYRFVGHIRCHRYRWYLYIRDLD